MSLAEEVMGKTQYSLKPIEVALIDPNPDNPRGKNVRDNDPSFERLKQSIEQFGLIVPLIVQAKPGDRYMLLDGERRFLALRELGAQSAPAHILNQGQDPQLTLNMMFHIHSNRREWGALEQCRALEPYYVELAAKHSNDARKILKEMVELAGGNPRTLGQRLVFLKWPQDIKDVVYNEKTELFWTVVEIEIGIIAPAITNFPAYFQKVSPDDVRRTLFEKYLNGHVKAAIEARKVREIVRTPRDKRKQHTYAGAILKRLVDDISYTFDDAKEDFLTKFPAAEEELVKSRTKLVRALVRLANLLRDFDFSSFKLASPEESEHLREAWNDLAEQLSTISSDNADIFGDD